MPLAALALDASRDTPRYVGDDAALAALFDLGTAIVYPTGFALVVSLTAPSLAILRTRTLPAWLGWFGLAVALVQLLAQLAIFTDPDTVSPLGVLTFIGFILLQMWVLATTIVLMRSPTSDGR